MSYVDLLPGGLAAGTKPGDYDPVQLHAGMLVEMEHTGDPRVAREIAMDHLTEHPGYYPELAKMEARMQSLSGNGNVAGSSFETALPKEATAAGQAAALDSILGSGTYRVRSRVLVQRRGRWYQALTLDLYSGTPLVMYFHWPFPPGRKLVRELRPRGLPPIRTALAFGEIVGDPVTSKSGINPGAMALLIGGGLLAAGYVLTRKGVR